MKYLINHKRFKRNQLNEDGLTKYFYKKNRIVQFPQYEKNYYSFFNSFAKKNYKLIKNNCLCGGRNDLILSEVDRHCVNFITVICKNCGLIRANEYFRDEDVKDFYKNFYRTTAYDENYQKKSAAEMFESQKRNAKYKFDLLNRFTPKQINNLRIVDVGGGAGGALDNFNNSNEKYLLDYFDPYLNYAETKGIKSVKGGLNEIDFNPDIIIMSHVIEHWNNFENEIKKLIKIQKKNETLNYIEFPGVDSLKKGRRGGDFLGDLHIPHVYYFSSYVFENLMNRYGFKKIYLDSQIKSIFIYTGKLEKLINYYEICKKDLLDAEKTRKIQILKNIIKLFIPNFFIMFFRKIRNKKINF